MLLGNAKISISSLDPSVPRCIFPVSIVFKVGVGYRNAAYDIFEGRTGTTFDVSDNDDDEDEEESIRQEKKQRRLHAVSQRQILAGQAQHTFPPQTLEAPRVPPSLIHLVTHHCHATLAHAAVRTLGDVIVPLLVSHCQSTLAVLDLRNIEVGSFTEAVGGAAIIDAYRIRRRKRNEAQRKENQTTSTLTALKLLDISTSEYDAYATYPDWEAAESENNGNCTASGSNKDLSSSFSATMEVFKPIAPTTPVTCFNYFVRNTIELREWERKRSAGVGSSGLSLLPISSTAASDYSLPPFLPPHLADGNIRRPFARHCPNASDGKGGGSGWGLTGGMFSSYHEKRLFSADFIRKLLDLTVATNREQQIKSRQWCCGGGIHKHHYQCAIDDGRLVVSSPQTCCGGGIEAVVFGSPALWSAAIDRMDVTLRSLARAPQMKEAAKFLQCHQQQEKEGSEGQNKNTSTRSEGFSSINGVRIKTPKKQHQQHGLTKDIGGSDNVEEGGSEKEERIEKKNDDLLTTEDLLSFVSDGSGVYQCCGHSFSLTDCLRMLMLIAPWRLLARLSRNPAPSHGSSSSLDHSSASLWTAAPSILMNAFLKLSLLSIASSQGSGQREQKVGKESGNNKAEESPQQSLLSLLDSFPSFLSNLLPLPDFARLYTQHVAVPLRLLKRATDTMDAVRQQWQQMLLTSMTQTMAGAAAASNDNATSKNNLSSVSVPLPPFVGSSPSAFAAEWAKSYAEVLSLLSTMMMMHERGEANLRVDGESEVTEGATMTRRPFAVPCHAPSSPRNTIPILLSGGGGGGCAPSCKQADNPTMSSGDDGDHHHLLPPLSSAVASLDEIAAEGRLIINSSVNTSNSCGVVTSDTLHMRMLMMAAGVGCK